MTFEEHKARHEQLHRYLDELLADFTTHTGKLFSDTPIMDLIVWSHSQTIAPADLRTDQEAKKG
jgi:hypothetical protein